MLIFQCSHWWCLPTLADISLESCSTQLQMIHKQLNEHWTIFTHIALIQPNNQQSPYLAHFWSLDPVVAIFIQLGIPRQCLFSRILRWISFWENDPAGWWRGIFHFHMQLPRFMPVQDAMRKIPTSIWRREILFLESFSFPFFWLNNSIWKFTEFVIKVLLPIGFLKSPTSIRTSREFVIANLFLESFSFHCKNIICMF